MKKFIFYFFGFLVFFFSFTASGFLDSQDGLQYLAIARRIYYDHTFEMPDESFETRQNIHMNVIEAKDGKVYPVTGLGYSLAMLPAVAIEDVFLRVAGLEPISAFPLQNDWPVLLFASMTNSFFASLLICVMYLYLREFKVGHYQAMALSFILFLASNLFPYAKHSFAHMMFASFLFLTFYLIKKYSQTKNSLFMYFAGCTYGVVTIAYNQTFIFSAPVLLFYYLILNGWPFSWSYWRKTLLNAFFGISGYLPFLVLYEWFNSLRAVKANIGDIVNSASSTVTASKPAFIIFEGLWGLLFSPGKSLFLFTPILAIFLIFWFKIEKKIIPELIASLLLSVIYVWFIGTFTGGPDYPVWHGESSWGPRYLIPILPMLLLIVGFIIARLSIKQLILVVAPLIILGIYIQGIGVVLPYQIRFRKIALQANINGRNWSVSEYGNFVPRYSPVFNMTKIFFERLNNKRQTLFPKNKVALIDGFDVPFEAGHERWRGMRDLSVIELKNAEQMMKIKLQFKNQQISNTSTQSGIISFYLNSKKIKEVTLSPNTEEVVELNNFVEHLNDGKNQLVLRSQFSQSKIAEMSNQQALFLQSLEVDGEKQDISLILYPYVSQFSQKTGAEYQYWGKANNDPWEIWHMHSGVYENTFDLWWLRPFQYWDLPKGVFAVIFFVNSRLMLLFGWKALRQKVV